MTGGGRCGIHRRAAKSGGADFRNPAEVAKLILADRRFKKRSYKTLLDKRKRPF